MEHEDYFFSSIEQQEKRRKSNFNNGENGAYRSGGSLRNPMYKNICCRGAYVPTNARNYRRAWERSERKEAKKLESKNKSVSKFHKGFA